MKFRIRDFEPGEMIAREPGMRILEIETWRTAVFGEESTYVFPLNSEDIAAFNALAFAINSHAPLPIEAGEP